MPLGEMAQSSGPGSRGWWSLATVSCSQALGQGKLAAVYVGNEDFASSRKKELSTTPRRGPLNLIGAKGWCQFLGWACSWPSLGVAKAAVSRYCRMWGQKQEERQEGMVDLICSCDLA